jgi:hypothetical protein
MSLDWIIDEKEMDTLTEQGFHVKDGLDQLD